jgi:nifR3 family TIM-barrel protein
VSPIKIGAIEIEFPVVLAALAGYSDLPYRLICRSCGAAYTATEAMLDRQVAVEIRRRRKMTMLDDTDRPIAGQIMGTGPATMAEAAAGLRELGFDVIDLNFACPVRKVISRKRGGYMMDDPGLALEIVRAVIDAVPDRPVTVKLRRAFRASDQAHDAFWKIAGGAFDAGVAAICVHARSVDQKYSGHADWGFLTKVKREFPDRTIIGSGDIHTAADALRMMGETGVDGVAAARGAIGNPWIFRQARDLAAGREPFKPGLDDQRELILRHFRLASDAYGSKRGVQIIHNFGIRYARVHPHPAKTRAAFYHIKKEKDLLMLLDTWYR